MLLPWGRMEPGGSLENFMFYIFIYFILCVLAGVAHKCHSMHMAVRGQVAGASPLIPCVSQGLNSGLQAG